MKKNIFMYLIIGTAFLFFGCSETDPLDSSLLQNDEVTTSLKVTKTSYIGISEPNGLPISLGTTKVMKNGNILWTGIIGDWYDTVTDEPLLTGQSLWYESLLYHPDFPEVKMWGKTKIIIEGQGTWHGTWHGYGTMSGELPYNPFISDLKAEIVFVATGKGGALKGMVAKATYTIDTSVDGLLYKIDGEYH